MNNQAIYSHCISSNNINCIIWCHWNALEGFNWLIIIRLFRLSTTLNTLLKMSTWKRQNKTPTQEPQRSVHFGICATHENKEESYITYESLNITIAANKYLLYKDIVEQWCSEKRMKSHSICVCVLIWTSPFFVSVASLAARACESLPVELLALLKIIKRWKKWPSKWHCKSKMASTVKSA